MTDVRRADPAVRRRVVLVFIVGTCVGALLIVAFERYRIPLSDWVRADPAVSSRRLRLVCLGLAGLFLAPLLAFAAYVWSLGGKVIRTREFPPPGLRVIRDTPVVRAERAVSRGRLLKVLALACGTAAVALGLLFWRFESLLRDNAG